MWMNNRLGKRVSDISPKFLPLLQKRDSSSEIFISRLSFYTTQDELKKAFSPFGNIKEARLIMDSSRSRPKGYAFVKYSSEEEAEKAVKSMNGRIYGGRLIFVELKKSEPAEGTS
ncbi:glycine-rich RNA-binding protein 4, mitochondrial-like [Iris pallida]|uniref:Glycine-rich RNA-binding protein 4, mitochondrial-like n=1 Tax=Iris pallida TaxID=29817 RepID=A0AAX6GYF7_IRIPA|nr:glycine-rich RNA-binding protein 4, mitochondrial-like [Iris pallida]